MKKTYEAGTWQGFKMGLTIDSKPVVIDFDAGTAQPEIVNNKFTTDSEKYQKAIEATKHFRIGKVKCINSVKEELSEGIEDVSSGDKPKKIDPKTLKIKEEVETPVKKETGAKVLRFKNWQQVVNWLETNREIDPSLLSDPESIAKVAKEQNLSLPNLG